MNDTSHKCYNIVKMNVNNTENTILLGSKIFLDTDLKIILLEP